ncbi:MAG: hypothetical protein OEZ06_02505 [Myxococcales bacterium]|nr:hypothetical protein [Myxococcales bacterium]
MNAFAEVCRPLGALCRDRRGAAGVEYAMGLCLLSLGAGLAVAGLGRHLLQLFYYQQLLILLPIP